MQDHLEILWLYGLALLQGAGALALALLVFLLLALLLAPRSPVVRRWPRVARGLGALTVGLAMLVGLRQGWQLRWLGDDAYISYRYAENLASGQGLVFNPGEWVEGYTNFLWTSILGLGIFLGASPVWSSLALGLASYAAAIGLTSWLGARSGQGLGPAPIVLALSYTLGSFATSGLETMFTALLVLVALALLEGRRPILAGLAAVMAGMAHPDHMLFAAAMGLALLATPGHRAMVLPFAATGATVYLPYTAWRVWAYGELAPNTAYAKSAGQAWFEQGQYYLSTSFFGAGMWALLPLAAIGLWRGRSSVLERAVAVGIPTYALYVASVGGDFMLGRLWVTVILLMVLLAERGFHALRQAKRPGLALGLGGLAIFAALPVSLLPPHEFVNQISDERTFYRLESVDPFVLDSPFKAQGESLYDTFTARGLSPRVAVRCVGMVGYYSKLSVFDLYGLTSPSVAHAPLHKRGRPGHEKRGTAGHVLEDGALLSQIPLVAKEHAPLTEAKVGRTEYYMARYEPDIVAALRRPWRPPAPVEAVQGLVEKWPTLPPEQVDCDLAFIESFYLAPGGAPRVEPLVRRAAAALPDGRGRVLDPLTDPPLWREGFDLPARWSIEGQAFRRAGRRGPVAGQDQVFGAVGAFVNSFLPEQLDKAQGTLTTEPFEIVGRTFALRVGGGRDIERLRVELRVGEQVLHVATGCNTDVLSRRTWDVSALRGQQAHLRIVDQSGRRYGHILVDELTQHD